MTYKELMARLTMLECALAPLPLVFPRSVASATLLGEIPLFQ